LKTEILGDISFANAAFEKIQLSLLKYEKKSVRAIENAGCP